MTTNMEDVAHALEWLSEFRGDDAEQCKKILQDLYDPSWEEFIALCHRWMEKYPPDIFDGSSGDPGPLFVVALRDALTALENWNDI